MPTHTGLETAIKLHAMADAILVLTSHLPSIDPTAIAAHIRPGFENSLTRVHDAIHTYKTRAAARPRTQPQRS